jgi:hypothetical protein
MLNNCLPCGKPLSSSGTGILNTCPDEEPGTLNPPASLGACTDKATPAASTYLHQRSLFPRALPPHGGC